MKTIIKDTKKLKNGSRIITYTTPSEELLLWLCTTVIIGIIGIIVFPPILFIYFLYLFIKVINFPQKFNKKYYLLYVILLFIAVIISLLLCIYSYDFLKDLFI